MKCNMKLGIPALILSLLSNWTFAENIKAEIASCTESHHKCLKDNNCIGEEAATHKKIIYVDCALACRKTNISCIRQAICTNNAKEAAASGTTQPTPK